MLIRKVNIYIYIYIYIWGLPKIRGTFFGDPYNKDIYIGVYIGVPLFRGTTIFRYAKYVAPVVQVG